jgi:hypothetical protein
MPVHERDGWPSQILSDTVQRAQRPVYGAIVMDGECSRAAAADVASVLETLPLRQRYAGEDLPPGQNHVFPGQQVEYLAPAEREEYRLRVDERGLLRDARGRLFDTTDGRTLHTPQGGRAIFVMDECGNLYASKRHVAGEFQHSTFLGGQPVAAAGELKVTDGRLVLVSNKSHHYMPPPEYLIQAVRHMVHLLGVKVDEDAQLETVEWGGRDE